MENFINIWFIARIFDVIQITSAIVMLTWIFLVMKSVRDRAYDPLRKLIEDKCSATAFFLAIPLLVYRFLVVTVDGHILNWMTIVAILPIGYVYFLMWKENRKKKLTMS